MASVSNVSAGKPKIGGAISVAPTGTTLPTDAVTALGNDFANLGYVSEDGLTRGITRDSDVIKAWGGDPVLTIQTDFAETFQFSLIEILDVNVKKVLFGDANVTGTLATGITAKVNSAELPEKVYAIDMIQNGAVSRIVVPHGKVTEIGDIVYADGEPIGYEITVTGLPDTAGNTSYEYTVAA